MSPASALPARMDGGASLSLGILRQVLGNLLPTIQLMGRPAINSPLIKGAYLD